MMTKRANPCRVTAAGAMLLLAAAAASACGSSGGTDPVGNSSQEVNRDDGPQAAATPQLQHGMNVWLKATFGGEQFFSIVLPDVLNLPIGLSQVLTTPRSQRFTQWGVVNDPSCTDGSAATGGLDVCPPDVAASDPDAPFEGLPSGIVGIRKFPNPSFTTSQPPSATNSPWLVGVACAGCHAGLNAQNPPADPNHPTWANISLTTGNQYIEIGKIFGANLPPSDPRWQVFNTWAPGTVDTTAIENDGVNNPGIITQFFDFPDRPYFTVHQGGGLLNSHGVTGGQAHRAGQGGEDDVGCQLAATRVYFNIGMCAAQCMLPHLGTNPPATQTPIDLDACASACAPPNAALPYFAAQQADVADECAFINDAALTPPPALTAVHDNKQYIDYRAASLGQAVFQANCASCHSNGQSIPSPHNVYSDDQLHPASGFNPDAGEPSGDVGTNDCRAMSTNWNGGAIWAEFSSDELKASKAAGPAYRDVPLYGIWATAPFFHNNRLGPFSGDPSIAGRVAAFESAFDLLLNPQKRNEAASVQVSTAAVTLPNGSTIPAGTPVGVFASPNPASPGTSSCDYVENGGHYFGAQLSDSDKQNLREFLKTL
jgi:mono/diheme cytochrome c family protein